MGKKLLRPHKTPTFQYWMLERVRPTLNSNHIREILDFAPRGVASFDMGAKNLALCVLDSRMETVVKWCMINIWAREEQETQTVVNSKKRTLDEHVEAFVPALDQHLPDLASVVHVAIEQQPAGRGPFANTKMQNLQNCLKTWFLTRLSLCADIVSPKLKLNITRAELAEDDAKNPDGPPTTPKKASERYHYHKKRAITTTEKLLHTHTDATRAKMFTSTRKKDDFADAFLQGLWWIRARKEEWRKHCVALKRVTARQQKAAAAAAKRAGRKKKASHKQEQAEAPPKKRAKKTSRKQKAVVEAVEAATSHKQEQAGEAPPKKRPRKTSRKRKRPDVVL